MQFWQMAIEKYPEWWVIGIGVREMPVSTPETHL